LMTVRNNVLPHCGGRGFCQFSKTVHDSRFER
jgi:hypothetical protein